MLSTPVADNTRDSVCLDSAVRHVTTVTGASFLRDYPQILRGIT